MGAGETPQVSGPIKAVSCCTFVWQQAFGHAAHAERLTKMHTNHLAQPQQLLSLVPLGSFGQI